MVGTYQGRGGAQSLWKASEVDYDQTLPEYVYVYIAKHNTLDAARAKVMVQLD